MSTLLKPRPTVYKGIHMRSRLEARFAAALDASGRRWSYEPCAFADETGQYLPDFEVHDRIKGGRWFYEVKPTLTNAIKAIPRVQPVFSSEHAVVFITWPMPGGWGAICVARGIVDMLEADGVPLAVDV